MNSYEKEQWILENRKAELAEYLNDQYINIGEEIVNMINADNEAVQDEILDKLKEVAVEWVSVNIDWDEVEDGVDQDETDDEVIERKSIRQIFAEAEKEYFSD